MVGYKNESFYDGIAEKLLVAAGPDPKTKKALVSLLYSFHLQKRYNVVARGIFNLLREEWRSLNCRVEEWIELVVAVANLVSSSERDCKDLVLDIINERIWPYRKHLSTEQLVSCLASVAMIIQVPIDSPKLKEITQELSKLIRTDRNLRTELKLLARISAECLSISVGSELTIPESVKSLAQLETYYRDIIVEELRERHDSIGSNLSYERVCKEFY